MKIRILQFILVAFFAFHQSCVAPAQMATSEPKLEGTAYASIQADLREERNVTSKTIIIIESGDEILIVDNSDVVFYKVKYKEHTGYVSKNFLTKTRPTKSTYSSPSPTYTPSTRSTTKTADCRTVQCSGTTKKGARCKNITTNCSGRCHLH
jgi:uncharacterized protein YgiM (DUF1202 family)